MTSYEFYAPRSAALFIAVAAFSGSAVAQTANTTVPNINVLNLLSPFLGLNSTPIGQQTLTANLQSALSVNKASSLSPVIEAVSISDKTIFGGPSTSINLSGGGTQAFGPGANLAGGLPLQAVQSAGGIAPFQQYGGLGSLGSAFQAAVNPAGGSALLPSVVTLLNNAYNNLTSSDLGVSKNYFANGTINGTVTAVAPSGLTLPTFNGLPNTTNSVYDTAYGVSNTGVNQNIFGDSRPVQVAPTQIIGYDPTALTGLNSNPSFPSGHTNYGFTDGVLIGMLVPQFYQAMVLRGSEYGNSRIALGVHYPLDIIASRAFSAYELSQALNNNPNYTSFNLQSQFIAAQAALTPALASQTGSCGGTLTACAANNPYNAYSLSTYATSTATTNSQIYQSRLTYGLPTLSFTAAPREAAPAGGPDASILLATVYGGSTAAAQALAPNGGISGNLSTATINQILVNTETNALTAFYGTSLSYWSRLDLYDAAGYFQNVTGTLTLASADQVSTNVTVGSGGVLSGTGTIGATAQTNTVEVQAGGALAPGASGETSGGKLTVNGAVTLDAGSKFASTGFVSGTGATSTDIAQINGNLVIGTNTQLVLHGAYLPGTKYRLINVSGGGITGAFNPAVVTDQTSLMAMVSGTPQYGADPFVFVVPHANFVAATTTPNQAAVAAAIDTSANGGGYGASGALFLNRLLTSTTVASAPAAFASLSGEGLSGQQQTDLDAGDLFARTVLGQVTFWGSNASIEPGRFHVWATGFGQYNNLNGDSGQGSASVTSHNAGFASGIDYQATQNLVIGVAAGYSSSNFSVSNRSTSGTADGAHFGVYGLATFGDVYVTGMAGYYHFDNTTDRFVSGIGASEEEKGKFATNEALARFEAGYKYRTGGFNVTPFGGFQVASLSNDGFSENSAGGMGQFSLSVNARTIASDKVFAGGQVDTTITFENGWSLMPYARLSWEHEFNTDRTVSASLTSLPANFTVSGAPAASDMGRLSLGAKLGISANIAAYASFDGGWSGQGNSYAGLGGFKVTW